MSATRDTLQAACQNRPLAIPLAWGLGPVACSLLLLLLAGCVRRSLTIRTDPAGALVYVNDQFKGKSPVTYDFTWYGWHRLTVRKNGYERVDDRKFLRAPVDLWIPFDLVMELLPFQVRDARTWSYTLTRAEPLPTPIPPALTSRTTQPQAEAPGQDAEAPVTQPDEPAAQPEATNPKPAAEAPDDPR